MRTISIYPTIEELTRSAALMLIEAASAALEASGRASIALSGGSTPQRLYALLASEPFSERVNWGLVHFFWGDERCVPPDHPDSNYLRARRALLDNVPVPPENIHRIPGEQEPQQAAAAYEQELRGYFGEPPQDQPWHSFDLALLGLGEDAHTASLFPGTTALAEQQRWVAANYVEKLGAWRITLTTPLLNRSKRVLFLVSGSEKRWAVQKVLYGSTQHERYPAQSIQPQSGEVTWLLDEAAAGLL